MPSKTAPAPASLWRHAGYALVSLFFAFVQLRLIALLLPKAFELSARAGAGVAAGQPDWRVFQNRVLGPWLVEALGALGGSIADAYAAFALIVLFLTGFGVLALTDRLRDRTRPPLGAFLLLHASLAVVLPCIWLFPWDLLSLVFFTAFTAWVLFQGRVRSLVAIYAGAILNHEMALFMAAWLVLDPIARVLAGRAGRGTAPRFDRARALTGVALGIAGLAVIEGLRRALLVREVLRPENLPPLSMYGRSAHFSLFENLHTLGSSFTTSFPAAYPFVVPAFLLGVMWLAVRLARTDAPRCTALAWVNLGMVAALLCFGLIFETRVLMPLVPFVAMNGWPMLRRGAETA
jgi:hypothetical protein